MIRNIDVALARAFVAVVETGSVTLAARQLNLTQGAVSQQLGRLEELSADPLFMRAGRSIAPTAAGQRLAPVVRQYLSANDRLLAALAQPAFRGEVRFGAPYDIIGSYAPLILRRFAKAYPDVRVTLVCLDSLLLLDRLRAGKIDLALTTETGCRAGGETLRSDRLVWVGAQGGEAYRKDPLPVSLGAGTCVFRPVAVAALKKAGRKWQAICEVSNMEPVRATLEADLAVAPLLSHSVPGSLDIVDDRRLPKLPLFKVNLYQSARLGAAAQEFASHVRRSVAVG